MYAPARPTSWMLQELAPHSLTTNIAIISKRKKGNSGEWSIWADKLIRNVSTQSNGEVRRAPEWECPNFWFANIRNKYAVELLGILPLKDKKRLAKSPPSKGGNALKRLRLKNRLNPKGKGREGSRKWKFV